VVFEYNEYIVLSTSLFRDLPNREYTYFLTVVFLAIRPLIFLMDASSLSWNAFSNSAFNFFFRWLFSRVFLRDLLHIVPSSGLFHHRLVEHLYYGYS